MPRLVRKHPLLERIKAACDPFALWLWLSEELHESSWDESVKEWTLPIGVAANILLIITRANSGGNKSSSSSDVFGDFEGSNGSGWFAWLVSMIRMLLLIYLTVPVFLCLTHTGRNCRPQLYLYLLSQTQIQAL